MKQFPHNILCMIIQEKGFSCYALLTNQISLSDGLYFLRFWAICVLRLFVNQNFEINLFLIKSFYTWPISQDKNPSILRTKTALKGKIESIFKWLSVEENCLRPESASFMVSKVKWLRDSGTIKSIGNMMWREVTLKYYKLLYLICNCGQSLWNNVNKPSKITQDRKCIVFDQWYQNFISGRETGH